MLSYTDRNLVALILSTLLFSEPLSYQHGKRIPKTVPRFNSDVWKERHENPYGWA